MLRDVCLNSQVVAIQTGFYSLPYLHTIYCWSESTIQIKRVIYLTDY